MNRTSLILTILLALSVLAGIFLAFVRQNQDGYYFGWNLPQTHIRNLENQLSEARAEADALRAVPPVQVTEDRSKGLRYEVQIGAFKHFDLKKYRESFVNMHAETSDLDKYTLGTFTRYDVAQKFKKDMHKMGVRDAFIVAKLDGKRINIKEALKLEKNK